MKQAYFRHQWLLILLFTLLCIQTAQGQTTLFSQQWYSRVNRNPAAAASGQGDYNFGLLYRNQWRGIEGSPKTLLFNADTYIESLRSGFGLSVSYDQAGQSMGTTNAVASYGYRVQLGSEWSLSLGLGVGLMYFSKDPGKDQFADPTDGSIGNLEHVHHTTMDFNTGGELLYHSLTLGVALDHLLNKASESSMTPKVPQEFFLYGRYAIDLPKSFELAPQIAYGYVDGENLSEIGLTATYNKAYWLGVNWRINTTAAFMFGLSFSDFRLGYSYELGLRDVGALSEGTHELMLLVSIGQKRKK